MKKKLFGFGVLPLFICAFLTALLAWYPDTFKYIDNLSYDTLQRINTKGKISQTALIIDIDEKSLNEIGQWPWPRFLLADLIEKTAQNGAAAIALDILLDAKDRSSPKHIKAAIESHHSVKFDISSLPKELQDNDLSLINALKKYPVALGAYAFFDDEETQNAPLPKALDIKSNKADFLSKNNISQINAFILPLDDFSKVSSTGLLNVRTFDDGITRSVPLIARFEDKIYPSLALRAVMLKEKTNELWLDFAQNELESVKFGKIQSKINSDGSFNIIFSGKKNTYTYISASDVINGKVAPNALSGKIAFIGSSANGLYDIRSTPLEANLPNVELHANIVDNLLSAKSIITPAWAFDMHILAIFTFCLLCIVFLGFSSSWLYIPLASLFTLATCFGSNEFFKAGYFISPAPVLVALILFSACLLLVRFYFEEHAKKEIKSVFSRYVSPHVISKMMKQKGNLLEGEQKEISILFTDIRGFTSISEALAPSDMVRLLNSYFTPMSACVKELDGTMDKFIGDALMAFWNAPLEVADHAQKAITCAIKMQEKLNELRGEIKERFGVELNMGAGINTGTAHVGNMGTDELLDYTCIGDNVNLASRLEGLCKYYGVGIVISQSTANKTELSLRKLDKIKVKGKNIPIEIYTTISEDEIKNGLDKKWNNALGLYLKGEFEQALRAFKDLNAYEVASKLFIDRLLYLLKNPPQNWQGVWEFKSK